MSGCIQAIKKQRYFNRHALQNYYSFCLLILVDGTQSTCTFSPERSQNDTRSRKFMETIRNQKKMEIVISKCSKHKHKMRAIYYFSKLVAAIFVSAWQFNFLTFFLPSVHFSSITSKANKRHCVHVRMQRIEISISCRNGRCSYDAVATFIPFSFGQASNCLRCRAVHRYFIRYCWQNRNCRQCSSVCQLPAVRPLCAW